MKVALIFRGDNISNQQGDRSYIDALSCYGKWKTNIFDNLTNNSHEYDIIFITYDSSIISNIREIFNPKDIILIPRESQYHNLINIVEFMKNNENNYDRFVILRCDFTYRIPIVLWPKWDNTGIIVVNRDVHWPSLKLYSDILFICDSSSIYNFENAVLSIKDHKTLHAIPKYLYDNNIHFTLMYDEYYHMNAHPLHILETIHNNEPTHITDISQWNPGINLTDISQSNPGINETDISQLNPGINETDKVYVSGGKTGDLIHVLLVIYANWINGKGKGILYLSDNHGGDGFSLGINQTYNDITLFHLLLKLQVNIEYNFCLR